MLLFFAVFAGFLATMGTGALLSALTIVWLNERDMRKCGEIVNRSKYNPFFRFVFNVLSKP